MPVTGTVNATIEPRPQIISPRTCLAISFLAALRWLKEKLGVWFAHRSPVPRDSHPANLTNRLGGTSAQ